ncbi:hypothetical protein OG735_17600 [Streptomyces sp. NBC_01210]|uniref:hypothetical protein n=1 Tax=Streptomyces sp. NBC_01210 TaxID=2903774 RepID=UPI002E14CFCD|nr:hypothetical protein OG735_17600 [Streptomyces sp. NBC_01210]
MSVLKDRGDGVDRPGSAGFVPWLMTLVALTPLALTAAWLGGSLGVALVGHGWNPPPFSLDSLTALVGGGTGALWPGAPTGAVVAGISALAGVLFAAAALCFFAVDGAFAAMATRRSADTGSAHVGEHTPAPVPARGSDAPTAPPSHP